MGTAFAQTAEGGGPPAFLNLGFLLVLVAVFYFLLIRPEQSRRRQTDQMLGNLKRNDQVVMTSGIHGRVTAISDKLLTVEIAPKVLIQVERNAVQSVQKSSAGDAREKEREKS